MPATGDQCCSVQRHLCSRPAHWKAPRRVHGFGVTRAQLSGSGGHQESPRRSQVLMGTALAGDPAPRLLQPGHGTRETMTTARTIAAAPCRAVMQSLEDLDDDHDDQDHHDHGKGKDPTDKTYDPDRNDRHGVLPVCAGTGPAGCVQRYYTQGVRPQCSSSRPHPDDDDTFRCPPKSLSYRPPAQPVEG